MTNHHIPTSLSRRRPAPSGDEEATTTLRLGEFQDISCLSVAEANVLLQRVIEQRENPGEKAPLPNTDVFVKTKEYLAEFARFRDQGAVMQVANVLDRLTRDGVITHFERAQLGTLCCDTVEEARTLIPSLEGKVPDEELQQILDDISKLRDFS